MKSKIKALRIIIRIFFFSFIIYTLYLLLMFKVLNIVSMKCSYNLSSKAIEKSKENGYYINSYCLNESTVFNNIKRANVPNEIFVERFRLYMGNYYFYLGRTFSTGHFLLNASELYS